MPSPPGPLLPRRRLGAELRRLRGSRTLDTVAEDTLISTSKLSRLEKGQGAPQPRDIRDLINYYDADRATADRIRRWAADGRSQAWWKEYSDVISDTSDAVIDYESGASLIRTYQALALPGLLQTPAYAEQVFKTIFPQRTPETVDKLVKVRLRRQEILMNDDEDATRLLAVIDEAAILRARFMSGSQDAKEQLQHLHAMSRRRNVTIRIVPLTAGLHAGMTGNFTVYQFADDMDRDVVNVETQSGDRHLEEQASVLEFLRLFDAVSHRALDTRESRNLMTSLTDAPPPPPQE